MHGTIRPQRKQQIDAEFWGAYLIVIAAAAIVTMTHPKPGLIPLLLWYARHPLSPRSGGRLNRALCCAVTARRCPPPWSIDELYACFIVGLFILPEFL